MPARRERAPVTFSVLAYVGSLRPPRTNLKRPLSEQQARAVDAVSQYTDEEAAALLAVTPNTLHVFLRKANTNLGALAIRNAARSLAYHLALHSRQIPMPEVSPNSELVADMYAEQLIGLYRRTCGIAPSIVSRELGISRHAHGEDMRAALDMLDAASYVHATRRLYEAQIFTLPQPSDVGRPAS